MDWSCGASAWCSDHLHSELNGPIKFRDHLCWWLEDRLSTVFGWAYAGSDQELLAVYNSELPLECFSDRQRALLTLPRQFYGAHCIHCFFDGHLDQCVGDKCPDCGEHVYLDEFDPEEPKPIRPLLIKWEGAMR